MKFWYINLDNASERKEHIESEFKKHSYEYRRVEAIHYTTFEALVLHSLKNAREAACHNSHVKAIKEFINSNDKYGIICEDYLSFDYKQYWKCNLEDLIKQMPKDTGIVQLCSIYSRINIDEDKIWHKQPHFFKWGTIPNVGSCAAYIITRECAIELYDYYNFKIDKNRSNSVSIRENSSFSIKENCIIPPADSSNGIYGNVNNYTNYIAYTYKYPMFTYRDNNDSQLGNCLNGQESSKRQIMYYLRSDMLNNK